MRLDDVVSVPVGRSRKRSFRVGRGPGSGLCKTAGRGGKGSSARTGWTGLLYREGGQMPLFRRVPKKGFNNARFRVAFEVVNIDRLAPLGASGEEITPDSMKAAGLIKKSALWVKVLGKGDLKGRIVVAAHRFSVGAKARIESAGGAIRLLPGPRGETVEPRGRRPAPPPPPRKGEAVPAGPKASGKEKAKAAKAAEAAKGAADASAKAAKAPKAPKAPKDPKAPRPPKAAKKEGKG